MWNCIEEAELELLADRLSSHAFRINQLGLWLATIAHMLLACSSR